MKTSKEQLEIFTGKIAELEAENRQLKQNRLQGLVVGSSVSEPMPCLMAFKDPQSIYLMVNPAGCELLGKEESEIIGRTDGELFSELNFKTIHDLDSSVTASGKPGSAFISLEHNSASRTILLHEIPVYDRSGALAGILSTMRDISGQSEREWKISLRSTAFDHGAHGIAIARASTKRIIDCNPAFARMHGMEVGELEGQGVLDLYPPEELPLVLDSIDRLGADGIVRFESVRIRKNGERFPVLMEISCIYDLDGEPAYHIASVQDITERKKAEQALQERETQFREVVESAPEAIYVQTNGYYAYLNPAAVALYGASDAHEMIGRSILEHIHPDFRQMVSDEIRAINTEQLRPDPSEHLHLRCDGSAMTLEILAVPFFYEGESGALVFARDASSRKKAEEERALLEKELYLSQKRESMGRFAGVVAHDLNNLLTPVLGYSDMIEKECSLCSNSERQMHHVHMIRKAGMNAKSLVQQLLAFSRSQAIEFDHIDLNSVVKDFEHLLRRTIRENIDIRYRLCPDPLDINGNAGQLQQILMNLAINAQDAMPGTGTLEIETARKEITDADNDLLPGSYAELSIVDTGKGIEPAIMPNIFEPFFTTKPKGLGTGLGLSTVYGIVRQHNATIRVQSEAGRGTTMRIRFPVISSRTDPETPGEEQQNAETRGKLILVAEDNEMVRNFVVGALELEGFTVLTASSGEEALSLFESCEKKPEMLLSDMIMGGMNGLELYEKIRIGHPGIKVVFMSGYSPDIFDSQGTFPQGLALLQKPFSMKTLTDKILEVFGQ